MRKRILIILLTFVFILTGCSTYNMKNMNVEQVLALGLTSNVNLNNVNNIGYRYYLPRGFVVEEDRDNIQILKSDGIEYFLNIDLVSYYNKTAITRDENVNNLYKYLPINVNNKTGFLEITQNNDYFLIKIVYNYAIIEANVKESEINNSVMNMAYIVSSIKYNDSIINNKFGEDVLELKESVYKIFGPEKKEDNKTYAYYLEQYNEYTGEINVGIPDPDVITNN